MNGNENSVIGQEVQLAKREVLSVIRSQKFWAGFVCVVAVLAVSGPFDTQDNLSLPGRVLYWAAIAIATFFPSMLVIRIVARWVMNWGLVPLIASVIAGIVSGFPVTAIVFTINLVTFESDQPLLGEFVRLLSYCVPIATCISVLQFLMLGLADTPPDKVEASTADPLSHRLKPQNRGKLISLNAQDHYIEVTTHAGTELLLHRFTDALNELKQTDGFQVHRSWWVARAAVDTIEKDGARARLVLHGGKTVPISRSRLKEVRAWLES